MATRIRELAQIFHEQECERTSNALLGLIDEMGKPLDEHPEQILFKLFGVYRNDYVRGDADFAKLFDFIEGIVRELLRREKYFSRRIRELKPLITSMNESVTVMSEIATTFLAAHLNEKRRYYAGCLIHALDVEGVFDEACRLLYILYNASVGETTRLADIQAWSISDFREKMKKNTGGKSEVLFLGWQCGHLRNSVAHMKMRYNDVTKKMRFRDVYHGKVTYDEKLSFQEFSKYYNLTMGVSSVFNHLMTIREAYQTAIGISGG